MSRCVNSYSFFLKRKNGLCYGGLSELSRELSRGVYSVSSTIKGTKNGKAKPVCQTNETFDEESDMIKKNTTEHTFSVNEIKDSKQFDSNKIYSDKVHLNKGDLDNVDLNNFDCMEKLVYELTQGKLIVEKHYVYTTDGYRLNLYRIVKRNKNDDSYRNTDQQKDRFINVDEEKKNGHRNGNKNKNENTNGNERKQDNRKQDNRKQDKKKQNEKKKKVFCMNHGLFESSMNFICKGYDSLALQIYTHDHDVWLCNNRGNSFTKYVGKNVAIKKLLQRYSPEDMKDLGFNMTEYLNERKKMKKLKSKLKQKRNEKERKYKNEEIYKQDGKQEQQEQQEQQKQEGQNKKEETTTDTNFNTFYKTNKDTYSTKISHFIKNENQIQRDTSYYASSSNVSATCTRLEKYCNQKDNDDYVKSINEKKIYYNEDTTENSKLQKIKARFTDLFKFILPSRIINRNRETSKNKKEDLDQITYKYTSDTNSNFSSLEQQHTYERSDENIYMEKKKQQSYYLKKRNTKNNIDNVDITYKGLNCFPEMNCERYVRNNSDSSNTDVDMISNVVSHVDFDDTYDINDTDDTNLNTDIDTDTDSDVDTDVDSNQSIENNGSSWTFEDMSTKDLPSIIKYIKKETKTDKIIFVGFSQGSIQLLMSSCLNDFVSNSIKKSYLLSLPIILKKRKELLKSMKVLLLLSKCSNPFLKGKCFIQNVFPNIIGEYLISNTAHILTHNVLKYYNETIDKKEQNNYFFNTPNGSTSSANLKRWISCFNNSPVTDIIEKHSYRCSYPKTLFYGNKDSIVDSQSSIKYMKYIFKDNLNVVINNNWSHLDPLWSDNKKIVISYILKDVQK